MKKHPFTPTGVAELQQDLYALDDAALAAEAAAIAADFVAWMDAHFDFAPGQLAFLQSVNLQVRQLIATQTSFAVGNRLPIILQKPELSAKDEKLIKPKSSLTADADGNGDYVASGELVIEISYG